MKYTKLTAKILARLTWWALWLLILVLAGLTIYAQFQTPSLTRDRYDDVAIMPTATFSGNLVTIRNIRNNTYRSEDDYDVSYIDQTFDLTSLDELWFTIEPFSDYRGPAHTFLSFGFSGQYISISVETRKEIGEHYDPLKWLAGQYELMYVIATEQDVINLRANYRHDDVYLYPIQTTPDKMRALFTDMVMRAQELGQAPAFYNTIYPNCTSSIRSHINKLREDRIPFSWKLILPSYSNELAYKLGLIQNPSNLPLKQLQSQHYINDIAADCPQDERFSQCIRSSR